MLVHFNVPKHTLLLSLFCISFINERKSKITAIIKYILDNGAETNILNIYGESPLYLSVLINNYEISCLLLKYNANPMFSINKQTPYDLAVEKNIENIVNLFNTYLKKEYVNQNKSG